MSVFNYFWLYFALEAPYSIKTPLTANKGEQDIDQLLPGSSSLPPIRERSSLSPDPEAEQELEHFLDSSNKVNRGPSFRKMGLKALTIFQIDKNSK